MIHSYALAHQAAASAQPLRWIASLIALVICCLVAAPYAVAQTASCRVTYTKSWEGGNSYGANLEIRNDGPAITAGWTLTFSFLNGERIQNGWPVSLSQPAGSAQVTVTSNAPWNQSIPTGTSFTVGFNGTFTTVNGAPTSFTFNGTTCGGGGPVVPVPTPPAVSLTATASGTSVLLTASASDPGGAVSRVDFYIDGTLVNADTSSPYTFTATGLAPGSHTARATAVDNGSPALTATATVPFTIAPAPVLSISAVPSTLSLAGGASGVSSIRLSAAPASPVTVTLTRSGSTEISHAPASVTLTNTNWNTGVNMTFTAAAGATAATSTFAATATGYTAGSISVSRTAGCAASALSPYINLNGTSTWKAAASANVNSGSRLVFGPQPAAGGSWSWNGCGTSGSSREQTVVVTGSCNADAVYTNGCGAQTTQRFTVNVWPAPGANDGKYIVVDQFGYLPNLKKVAILRDPIDGYDSADHYTPGTTIQVINASNGGVVYTGAAAAWNSGATDATSGDRVWTFDFSSFIDPGTYSILDVERNVRSMRFTIGDNVYRDVLVQAVRTFFYQRAGYAKPAAQVGAGWADGVSHLGSLQDADARRYNASSDATTARDLRGGWYDAGDFNKYTSWAAGYVVDLLHAYMENTSVWTDDFNIGESNNGVPDVLDEAKWGLDWLVRMQNSDGSVLSIVGLASGSPPSSATGQSLYGNPSTSATLAAAAAYAYGAKVFASLNSTAGTNYANDLVQRAQRAWDWANANPNVIFYNNDSSRGTGGLGAGQQETDDTGRARLKLSAATYLFAQTGDSTYRSYVDAHYTEAPLFASWWLSPFDSGVTRPLLYYASLPGSTSSVASDIRTRYLDLWDRTDYGGWGALNAQRDPYRAFLSDYTWGSNGVKGLAGGMFADEKTYGISRHSAAQVDNAAADYLHYLHGVNPLGKAYLSNMNSFGAENSIDQFFHSWFSDGSARWDSVKTSTYGPPPGFLVGGPNPSYSWDDRCPGVSTACGSSVPSPPTGQPAQKSYKDFNTSWPLNSWSISENSNGYQSAYIRLLARFVK